MRKLKPRIVRSFSKVCLALQTAHNPQTGHCEEMLSGRVLGTGSVYTEHSLLFTFEGCLFGSSSLSECFCVEFSMVRHEQIFQRSAKRTSPSMIQGQGNKMIISSVQLLSRDDKIQHPFRIKIFHKLDISYTLQRKKILIVCNNMDKPGGHYAKWNKTDTEK